MNNNKNKTTSNNHKHINPHNTHKQHNKPRSRGGKTREYTEKEREQLALRPVRQTHNDPPLPDTLEAKHLRPEARNQLKTLHETNQTLVAKHLAMAEALLEENPQQAHAHATSAARRGGRIPVVRETLAITAYHTGDYTLALRELRTYKRLSGSNSRAALQAECERALGRPEKALELAATIRETNTKQNTAERVYLAIAAAGARHDLGQKQQAVYELEIPELNPASVHHYSPELFTAYAHALEETGEKKESIRWHTYAKLATEALQQQEQQENDNTQTQEIIDTSEETPTLHA